MELITVTVIIAILSTISYTSYKGYHARARAYEAKRDLSSIVSIAEVFKANAGFYLPNLREMHIPIKGRHSYNYKVLCHDKNGSVVKWGGTGNVKDDTCGYFNFSAYPDPTPDPTPVENTLNAKNCEGNPGYGSNQCWMGYVLCHSSPPNSNSDFLSNTPPLGGFGDFQCTGAPSSYPNRGDYYPGVVQFKSASDEDWNDPNKVLGEDCTGNKGLACYFNIVDFTSKHLVNDTATPSLFSAGDPLCKRVSRKEDMLADPSHCFLIKEYAVDSASIPGIIQAHWTGDKESFISNPFKLVITALACKEKQDNCGTGVEHSIIRMDTNRLVKEIQ